MRTWPSPTEAGAADGPSIALARADMTCPKSTPAPVVRLVTLAEANKKPIYLTVLASLSLSSSFPLWVSLTSKARLVAGDSSEDNRDLASIISAATVASETVGEKPR